MKVFLHLYNDPDGGSKDLDREFSHPPAVGEYVAIDVKDGPQLQYEIRQVIHVLPVPGVEGKGEVHAEVHAVKVDHMASLARDLHASPNDRESVAKKALHTAVSAARQSSGEKARGREEGA